MYYLLPHAKKKINKLREQIRRLTKSKNASIKRHDKEINEVQSKVNSIGRDKASFFEDKLK